MYLNETVRVWDYAVKAGDTLKDSWQLSNFENNAYHLQVHGPNGFFRAFTGNSNDPLLDMTCIYEPGKSNEAKFSSNVLLHIKNNSSTSVVIEVTDNAYKNGQQTFSVNADDSKNIQPIKPGLAKSHGWYDFTIRVKGNNVFEKRYAGRVETGAPSMTDPFMGKVI